MATNQMKRVDVTKKGTEWVARSKGGTEYARGSTKAQVVKTAARHARNDPRAVTMRIHGKDGRIQEERTYPRSQDPRSSKG